MASSQSFSMIHRRISLSPLPASPVNSGDPLKTIAIRLPPSFRQLHLRQHVLQEQQRPVIDPRQPRPESPVKAQQVPLLPDLALLLLPLNPERRIRQHVVECEAPAVRPTRVTIGREGVAQD